jgi:hypothetical protein
MPRFRRRNCCRRRCAASAKNARQSRLLPVTRVWRPLLRLCLGDVSTKTVAPAHCPDIALAEFINSGRPTRHDLVDAKPAAWACAYLTFATFLYPG